jgi:hypothetical protein
MADHFVSINRGQEGIAYSDFTTGAGSSGALIELRLGDASGFRAVDILKALEAFERFFQNAQQVNAAGFVVNG